jgi:hypothetical protein
MRRAFVLLAFLSLVPARASAQGEEAIGYALTAPWWGPHLLLGDQIGKPAWFPSYPYALSDKGYLDCNFYGFEHEQDADPLDPARLKPWCARLSLDDGNDFNGLDRMGIRFAVDSSYRVGFQTNWNYFVREDSSEPRERVMGDAYFTYRFAQADWVQMHAGLGFRMLDSPHDTRAGFSALYSADVFPIQPLVFSGLVDAGSLGQSFAFHARATLGWCVGPAEFFAGYDFQQYRHGYVVDLQGPLAGVHFWF